VLHLREKREEKREGRIIKKGGKGEERVGREGTGTEGRGGKFYLQPTNHTCLYSPAIQGVIIPFGW